MSETAVIVERVREHPYIVLGGVAGVILLLALRHRRTTAAASNSGGTGGVYTVAADPSMVALQGAQIQATAATSVAAIQAQTAQSAIAAQRDVQLAALGDAADVATAKVGAGMFQTASDALSTNYALQHSFAGATGGFASPSPAMNGPYVIGSGDQRVLPDQARAMGLDPRSHTYIPVIDSAPVYNPGTGGDTGVINTANTQLEQLFNNVLRAGQGTAPLETTILTTPGTSGTVTGGNVVGHALVDPVFMDWTSNGLRSITDVTPGANNAFGFTGSFNPVGAGTALTFH